MSSAKELIFASFKKQYVQFGPIRLRQYSDLLGGEAEEYERQAREQAQLMMEVNEIAVAIGQNEASGMTADEAFALLTRAEVGTDLKIGMIMKYGPPGGAGAMAAVVPAQEQQATRMITLVLNSRGATFVEDDWLSISDWTDEDSRKLPRRLRNQIIEFMASEGNGGKTEGKHPKAKAKGPEELSPTPQPE